MKTTIIRMIAAGGLCAVFAAHAGAQTPDGPRHGSQMDIPFEEPFPGVRFGTVWGDRAAGPHGTFVQFAPGVASPPHAHSHDTHNVVIYGVVENPYVGEENPPRFTAGDHWLVPAGAMHVTACVSATPCLFYVHQHGPHDVIMDEGGPAAD